MKALAGDDDHPAVPGFDPDVSAELYTTNGDVTDDAYNATARRPTRSSSTAAPAPASAARSTGPTRCRPAASSSRTPRRPSRPSSRRTCDVRARPRAVRGQDPDQPGLAPGQHGAGLRADDVHDRPTAIRRPSRSTPSASLGDGQGLLAGQRRRASSARRPRRVRGRRALRRARHLLPPAARHRSAASQPGDSVKVWFSRGRQDARTRSPYTVEGQHAQQGAADGRRGLHGQQRRTGAAPRTPGPLYLDDYAQALTDAGIAYDVYDVDAQRPHRAVGARRARRTTRPSSGTRATTSTSREPGQPGGTGTSKLARRRGPRASATTSTTAARCS